MPLTSRTQPIPIVYSLSYFINHHPLHPIPKLAYHLMQVCGRTIRVDHVNQYRRPKDEHGSEIVEKGCAPRTPTPSPTPSPSPSPPPEKKKKKHKLKKQKKKKQKDEKRLRQRSPASSRASDSEQECAESRTLGGPKPSDRTPGDLRHQKKEKRIEQPHRKGYSDSESENEARAHTRGHGPDNRDETVLQRKRQRQRSDRPRGRSRSRSPVSRRRSPSRSPPPSKQRARDYYERRSRDGSPRGGGAWHDSGPGRGRDSMDDSSGRYRDHR